MRLPRWLLVTLIAVSGVALVAVPVWLWVEMPHRTAVRFIGAFESHDIVTANELLTDSSCTLETTTDSSGMTFAQLGGKQSFTLLKVRIVPVRRDLRELILGQQRLVAQGYDGRETGYEFRAVWNHVYCNEFSERLKSQSSGSRR
jgi:hypothetical protein